MKKFACLLLAMVLFITLFSGCNSQSNEDKNGVQNDGDNKSDDNIDNNAQQKEDTNPIKESPVEDFEYQVNGGNVIITKYKGVDTLVGIPEKIEQKDVVQIEEAAFKGNTNIVSVSFPNTIVSIGHQAFAQCASLTTVKLSDTLETIHGEAFRDCTNLSTITLPQTLTAIYANAFVNCASLKEIKIPKGVLEWGTQTFAYSGLERVEFEQGLVSIGSYAFLKTKIKQITIPSSVKTIDVAAFSHCLELESVVLNEGVETISPSAFASNTRLIEFVVPASVKDIHELVFDKCTALEAVRFEGNAPDKYIYEGSSYKAEGVNYTIYYHSAAQGFTSPVWNGYKTEIW